MSRSPLIKTNTLPSKKLPIYHGNITLNAATAGLISNNKSQVMIWSTIKLLELIVCIVFTTYLARS